MAHHGFEDFNEDRRKAFEKAFPLKSFNDLTEKLGSTGKFPDGKISEHDEGEIRLGIAIHEKNVIIEFGKPITWLGLNKEQALQIGQCLIDKANEI